MTTTITVCDTCKFEGRAPDVDGKTDGEKLAEQIEIAAQGSETVVVRRHSCLMGCAEGCNIAIQSSDKLNYVLGRFSPEENAGAGIVEYAEKHAESETGRVPFREWPQPIKGHFRARLPLLDDPAT